MLVTRRALRVSILLNQTRKLKFKLTCESRQCARLTVDFGRHLDFKKTFEVTSNCGKKRYRVRKQYRLDQKVIGFHRFSTENVTWEFWISSSKKRKRKENYVVVFRDQMSPHFSSLKLLGNIKSW